MSIPTTPNNVSPQRTLLATVMTKVAVVGLIEFSQHHAVAFLGRLIPGTLARIKARTQRVVRCLYETAAPRAVINQLELRVDLDEGTAFVIEHALRAAEFRAQRFDALGAGCIGRHLPVGLGHGRQLSENVHNALGVADQFAQVLSGQPQATARVGAENLHRRLPALPEGQQSAAANGHARETMMELRILLRIVMLSLPLMNSSE